MVETRLDFVFIRPAVLGKKSSDADIRNAGGEAVCKHVSSISGDSESNPGMARVAGHWMGDAALLYMHALEQVLIGLLP